MVDKEHRRKPFNQCSRRHQRRIMQEDIKKVYRQNIQYVQSYDNRVEIDISNIIHNDASNISSLTCIDEAEPVCIAKNNLQGRNLNTDFAGNAPISCTLMENDRENIQLLEISNNNVEKYIESYFEELIHKNNEYGHYNFDDDSDINELFDAGMQSDDEKSANLKSREKQLNMF